MATDSSPSKTGILLIQLGTPDAPTAGAVRPYLRQFLSDRRVVDLSRWLWWPLLNLIILPFRPRKSAEKYARIWDKQTGSPLLMYTRRQTEELQKRFPDHPVRFGMQYGNPNVSAVVPEMIRAGVERLLVLPMYPQYSATTTAAATDALFKSLLRETRVPALRIVPPHYEHPAYLDAMVAIIREEEAKLRFVPDHYVLSFHGIPIRYAQQGDPYALHVKRTTLALVKRLGWQKGKWTQTFQSLFGREEWLKPYLDNKLEQLAKEGKKNVFVVAPGFTADCLETIDEIGNEARELFEHAGGKELHRCPCLNDHPAWIDAMEQLLREEGQGWVDPVNSARP